MLYLFVWHQTSKGGGGGTSETGSCNNGLNGRIVWNCMNIELEWNEWKSYHWPCSCCLHYFIEINIISGVLTAEILIVFLLNLSCRRALNYCQLFLSKIKFMLHICSFILLYFRSHSMRPLSLSPSTPPCRQPLFTSLASLIFSFVYIPYLRHSVNANTGYCCRCNCATVISFLFLVHFQLFLSEQSQRNLSRAYSHFDLHRRYHWMDREQCKPPIPVCTLAGYLGYLATITLILNGVCPASNISNIFPKFHLGPPLSSTSLFQFIYTKHSFRLMANHEDTDSACADAAILVRLRCIALSATLYSTDAQSSSLCCSVTMCRLRR